MRILRESEIGRDIVTTSTEASRMLEVSLTRLKQIADLIMPSTTSRVRGSARRFSGRDLRNMQIFLRKKALGWKSKEALEYVTQVDSFLEDVFRATSRGFVVGGLAELRRETINVTSTDLLKKYDLDDLVDLHKPFGVGSMQRQSFEEKVREVEQRKRGGLIESSFKALERLRNALEKCGFILSLETQLKCLLFLLQPSVKSLEIEMMIKLEEASDERKLEAPIDRIEMLIKREK
jgi:hypothetical protein